VSAEWTIEKGVRDRNGVRVEVLSQVLVEERVFAVDIDVCTFVPHGAAMAVGFFVALLDCCVCSRW